MTRDEVIAYIAEYLWMHGIGSRAGGRKAAEMLVDNLIKAGVLVVKS